MLHVHMHMTVDASSKRLTPLPRPLTGPIWLLQDLDLIMYGDSIFESLLGTGMGGADPQFADTPAIWQKHQGDIKSKNYGNLRQAIA